MHIAQITEPDPFPSLINEAIETTETSIVVVEPKLDGQIYPSQYAVLFANSAYFQLSEVASTSEASLLENPEVTDVLNSAWHENQPRTEMVQFQNQIIPLVLQLSVVPVEQRLVMTLNDITRYSARIEQLEQQTTRLEESAKALESVRVALEAEISRRGRLENKLRILAETDPLSGLANRRSFMEKGVSEFLRSQRYNQQLSLVMLDLDHFKQVNDSFGHAAGDAAIVAVSQICRSLSRSGIDCAGRLGGEEFAILLPETDLEGAGLLGERLRSKIETTTILSDAYKLSVTASIGVSELGVGDKNFATLLNRADEALYAAKNAGRNQVSAG